MMETMHVSLLCIDLFDQLIQNISVMIFVSMKERGFFSGYLRLPMQHEQMITQIYWMENCLDDRMLSSLSLAWDATCDACLHSSNVNGLP